MVRPVLSAAAGAVRLCLLLAGLLTGLAAAMPGAAAARDLLVVANPSVDVPGPLAPRQVAAIYLLRTTLWPDGSHVIPVNRELGSPIRAAFTAAVLQQDNASLAAYWSRMHFQGKLPPLIQESEPAMIAFVRRVPGAVGYVNDGAPTMGLRVIARIPVRPAEEEP